MPLDVHIEALLNKMTLTNQLTATNIPLLGINEFTPTIYSEVTGIPVKALRQALIKAINGIPSYQGQFLRYNLAAEVQFVIK
ncbi:MAG: hypothetical protein IPL25_19185 [Saprospiraceae bacterium]|nr:hypothetical protein [Candidatus Vicinibacter affinis]